MTVDSPKKTPSPGQISWSACSRRSNKNKNKEIRRSLNWTATTRKIRAPQTAMLPTPASPLHTRLQEHGSEPRKQKHNKSVTHLLETTKREENNQQTKKLPKRRQRRERAKKKEGTPTWRVQETRVSPEPTKKAGGDRKKTNATSWQSGHLRSVKHPQEQIRKPSRSEIEKNASSRVLRSQGCPPSLSLVVAETTKANKRTSYVAVTPHVTTNKHTSPLCAALCSVRRW